MDKDQARHVALILNAWADGKMVQYNDEALTWLNVVNDGFLGCLWKNPSKYRIKPKPREWWAEVSNEGSIISYGALGMKPVSCRADHQLIHVREIIE